MKNCTCCKSRPDKTGHCLNCGFPIKGGGKDIAARLREHLDGDGTLNDGETDALYREAHHIPKGEDTDLETVERWALETANKSQ